MSRPDIRIAASGPAALRVVAGGGDREASWRAVHHIARRLEVAGAPGVDCVIPTYDAALVEIDPAAADLGGLRSLIEGIAREVDADEPLTDHPRLFDVPVLYDQEGELDLVAVAEWQGLDPSDIVRLHSESSYVIRCLGAPGGSPMLDGPDFPRPVPRLTSPRAHVPQGVVSVAGRQATLTPAAAPGGWPLIGRTPLTVLDLGSEPFVPYEPGDLIRFRPIDVAEYDALLGTRMAAR